MVWDLKVSHGYRQTVQDGCMGINVAGWEGNGAIDRISIFSLV